MKILFLKCDMQWKVDIEQSCGMEEIVGQIKWTTTNHRKGQSSSKGDVVYMVELEGIPLLWALYCCCSVAKSCLTLCDPMDCSTPSFPVPHHVLEFAQIHVHCISDAIQPSHPLLPSSPSAFNHSQQPDLFQWVNCSKQVAKVLELQLQSFQCVFRVDFL